MKKKAKSNPKKPKKAVAKKPTPKKPVAKKPKAKKAIDKKVTAKKPKVQAKPKKEEVKKVIVKKVVAKKPVSKKPVPKKAPAKPEPKAAAPAKEVKKMPKPPKKRFIVLPPRPLVPSEVKDDGKKPKGLYTLEYIVTSSPDVLFEFISTAGGLEKWFAPRVFLKDNIFVFSWENDEEKQARMLALREREFVRFRWLDQPEKRYFEFRMQIDDLTGEVALMVSDFADTKEELEESRLLWNAQIHDLLHALGSS